MTWKGFPSLKGKIIIWYVGHIQNTHVHIQMETVALSFAEEFFKQKFQPEFFKQMFQPLNL